MVNLVWLTNVSDSAALQRSSDGWQPRSTIILLQSFMNNQVLNSTVEHFFLHFKKNSLSGASPDSFKAISEETKKKKQFKKTKQNYAIGISFSLLSRPSQQSIRHNNCLNTF